MNITSIVGAAIHDDFFTVAGTGFPADASLEFAPVGLAPIIVKPDFIRPHLAVVGRLPTSIPANGLLPIPMRVISPSTPASNTQFVAVGGPPVLPLTIRILNDGALKLRPFTIAFVANPAIESLAGGVFTADPILSNRTGYHDVVVHCLQNLFGVTEDVLRLNDIDAQMRFVSIFDSTKPAIAANALARESPSIGYMLPRRDVLAAFLANFGVVADIVMVIHGSTTRFLASAFPTTDDGSGTSSIFGYDAVTHKHGHFPSIPGSCALSVHMLTTGITVLHEFMHAVADVSNGDMPDLYNDTGAGIFNINKKFRVMGIPPAPPIPPVPGQFAFFNGVSFASDLTRDGIGYDLTWLSYHCQLIDPSRPNVMDNYWLGAPPQQCRLDRISYAFVTDRLKAKLSR